MTRRGVRAHIAWNLTRYLRRSLPLAAAILVILSAPRFGWATALNLLGLVFDIAGAVTLSFGILYGHAALFRTMKMGTKQSLRWWLGSFPLALAAQIGPTPPEDVEITAVEEYEETFWGLLFLMLGFMLQAAGTVVGALPRGGGY